MVGRQTVSVVSFTTNLELSDTVEMEGFVELGGTELRTLIHDALDTRPIIAAKTSLLFQKNLFMENRY